MFNRRKPEPTGAAPTPTPTPTPPNGKPEPGPRPDVGMPSPDPFKIASRAEDKGVGIPPLRPVQKEAPTMGRTPFPSPTPATPPAPAPVPTPAGAPRPGIQPAAARPRETGMDRRTLVVGRGISVQGTVQDAERLVVEGTVEASMIHAAELSIAHGGVFRGHVEVEEAEIAGTIDGTLTARGTLIVRSTGKVLGTAHYRRMTVEDGGQITGEVKMITESGRPDVVRPVPAEAAAS